MSTFILGLDLGQTNDYSALIVAEQIMPEPAPPPADRRPRYDVRHIERFPLGTSYPAIVDATVAMFERPELGDNVFLVIDGTGVGRAPVDMFRDRIGKRAHPVTITSGDAVSESEDGYIRVPKRDLVGVVQVLLQSKRLRFAQGLQLVSLLTKELTNFHVKIDLETAHDSYGAWRAGQHDDLVLALALAVWAGENPVYFQPKGLFTLPFITGVAMRKRSERDWLTGRRD
jgi:hypothetical protein